jgi:hypothetical protein
MTSTTATSAAAAGASINAKSAMLPGQRPSPTNDAPAMAMTSANSAIWVQNRERCRTRPPGSIEVVPSADMGSPSSDMTERGPGSHPVFFRA